MIHQWAPTSKPKANKKPPKPIPTPTANTTTQIIQQDQQTLQAKNSLELSLQTYKSRQHSLIQENGTLKANYDTLFYKTQKFWKSISNSDKVITEQTKLVDELKLLLWKKPASTKTETKKLKQTVEKL